MMQSPPSGITSRGPSLQHTCLGGHFTFRPKQVVPREMSLGHWRHVLRRDCGTLVSFSSCSFLFSFWSWSKHFCYTMHSGQNVLYEIQSNRAPSHGWNLQNHTQNELFSLWVNYLRYFIIVTDGKWSIDPSQFCSRSHGSVGPSI
jgi:hypothetical protein